MCKSKIKSLAYSASLFTLLLASAGLLTIIPTAHAAANPGDVIINEFMAQPSSGNEWVELLNTTDSAIDLTGWTLLDNDTSGPGSTDINLSGTIPAGGLIIFEHTSGWLDNTFNTSNPNEKIELRDNGNTKIFMVSYGNSSISGSDAYYNGNATNGRSIYLNPSDHTNLLLSGSSPSSTKGWFNPGSSIPTWTNIISGLSSANITTSLNNSTNPTSASSPYFQATNGRVAYSGSKNLTDSSTVAALSNPTTHFIFNNDSLNFIINDLSSLDSTATLTFYHLTRSYSQSNIRVRDNSGNLINPSDPNYPSISNFSAGSSTSFRTSHFTTFEFALDTDHDGVWDDTPDNCISTPNADQIDNDGDGVGDACDIAIISTISSDSVSGVYGINQNIYLDINFDKIINIPDPANCVLSLNSGPARQALYNSGSSSQNLRFKYIVNENDSVNPLSINEIVCPGIIDNYGLTPNLTLPSWDSGLIIDGIRPSITILGYNPLTLERGTTTTYEDAGVELSDNYSLSDNITLNTVNNLNTDIANTYQYTYTATDEAGNQTEVTRQINVIDTIAPAAPSITSHTNPVNFANQNNISVEGNGEANTTLNYSINDSDPETSAINGSYSLDDSGTFSLSNIDVSALSDGNLTWNLYLTDASDNSGSSTLLESSKDTISPTIVFDSPTPENNSYTSTTTPTISISASEILASAKIFLNDDILGQDLTLNPDGQSAIFSIVPSADGPYSYKIIAIDNFGNQTETPIRNFTLDTVAPTVTTLGDSNTQYVIPSGETRDLNFSEILTAASQSSVENALNAQADQALTFVWTDNILNISAAKFKDDVWANISDLAGNTSYVFLIDSKTPHRHRQIITDDSSDNSSTPENSSENSNETTPENATENQNPETENTSENSDNNTTENSGSETGNINSEEGEVLGEKIYPDGSLLRDLDTGNIYDIREGMKWHIKSLPYFINNYYGIAITNVSSSVLLNYENYSPTVDPANFKKGDLIRYDKKIYEIRDNLKWHIHTLREFLSRFSKRVVTEVPLSVANQY